METSENPPPPLSQLIYYACVMRFVMASVQDDVVKQFTWY
jgi:hypothetical protein